MTARHRIAAATVAVAATIGALAAVAGPSSAAGPNVASNTRGNVASNAGPVATTAPATMGVASNGTCDPACMMASLGRRSGVAW